MTVLCVMHACCFLCKRRADNIPEILDVMQDPSVTLFILRKISSIVLRKHFPKTRTSCVWFCMFLLIKKAKLARNTEMCINLEKNKMCWVLLRPGVCD
jgi:hypothetical protein